VRAFVALDPPAEVRSKAAAWGREMAGRDRSLRWIPVAQIHLTLAFLGSVGPAGLDAAAEAVEAAEGPVGCLSLAEPVWLPKRKPRALAIAIRDEEGELARVRSELGARLATIPGFDTGRSFRPHLTVVRARRGFDRSSFGALPPSPQADFAGESLTLYRSYLDPEGARYEALHSRPLDA
jgi:2'-5' RNA ligase